MTKTNFKVRIQEGVTLVTVESDTVSGAIVGMQVDDIKALMEILDRALVTMTGQPWWGCKGNHD